MLLLLRTCLSIAGSIMTTFYPSLWFKNKMSIDVFENFCVSHSMSNCPKASPLPMSLPVSQTPLSSPHQNQAGGQRLGSFFTSLGFLNTTYLVIWETLIEIGSVQVVVGRWIYREMWGHTWRVASFVRNASWAADWTLFSHASVTHSVTRGLHFLFYKRDVWIRQSLRFLPPWLSAGVGS